MGHANTRHIQSKRQRSELNVVYEELKGRNMYLEVMFQRKIISIERKNPRSLTSPGFRLSIGDVNVSNRSNCIVRNGTLFSVSFHVF